MQPEKLLATARSIQEGNGYTVYTSGTNGGGDVFLVSCLLRARVKVLLAAASQSLSRFR